MAVLVTGGAGYIGSHTVVELQNAGYDVGGTEQFKEMQVKSTGQSIKNHRKTSEIL